MGNNIIDKQLNKYKSEILSIMENHGKLNAVKFIFDKKFGFGIREIKEYCDKIESCILTYNELKEQNLLLLEALKMVTNYRTTSKHDSNDYRKKFMEATEKAKEAINKCNTNQ